MKNTRDPSLEAVWKCTSCCPSSGSGAPPRLGRVRSTPLPCAALTRSFPPSRCRAVQRFRDLLAFLAPDHPVSRPLEIAPRALSPPASPSTGSWLPLRPLHHGAGVPSGSTLTSASVAAGLPCLHSYTRPPTGPGAFSPTFDSNTTCGDHSLASRNSARPQTSCPPCHRPLVTSGRM